METLTISSMESTGCSNRMDFSSTQTLEEHLRSMILTTN